MDDRIEFPRRGYQALQRCDPNTFKVTAREGLDPDFDFHLAWDERVCKGYERPDAVPDPGGRATGPGQSNQ